MSEKEVHFQLRQVAASFAVRVNNTLQNSFINSLIATNHWQQVEPLLALQTCDLAAYEHDAEEVRRLRRKLRARRPKSRSDRSAIAWSVVLVTGLAWGAIKYMPQTLPGWGSLQLLSTISFLVSLTWAIFESMAMFAREEPRSLKQWQANRQQSQSKITELQSAWESTFSLDRHAEYLSAKPLFFQRDGRFILRNSKVNSVADNLRKELSIPLPT